MPNSGGLLLAADSGTALSWTLAMLLVLVAKWGWLPGLASLAVIKPLCRTQNPWGACFLLGVLVVGMLMFVVSAAFFVSRTVPQKRPTTGPQTEVKRSPPH